MPSRAESSAGVVPTGVSLGVSCGSESYAGIWVTR
jgi:hypothetical protein